MIGLSTQTIAENVGYIVARPTPAFLLIGGIILVIALYIGNLIGAHCADKWKGNTGRVKGVSIAIMGIVTTAALLVYGTSIYTLQAMVLSAVCIYSSYSDLKSRLLEDFPHYIILVAALIGRNTSDLVEMAIAAAIIGGIMLVVAIVSRGGGLGGADIKFSAATAFLLGLTRGLAGSIVGLLLAVVIEFVRKKILKKDAGFPLVPYLSIGFMAAYFIK